jgi:hypothetical protein
MLSPLAGAGIAVSAIGYVVAIGGAVAVAWGAPEPHAHGTVPVGADKWKDIAIEAAAIERWKKRARWGNVAVIGGSSLQLFGTLLAAIGA